MSHIIEFIKIIIGGGIIAAIYKNYSQLKQQNRIKLNEICENKFRSILIFMDLILNPERIIHTSEINNPLLKSIDTNNLQEIRSFYTELIRANIANIYLYSDEKLIKAIKDFLETPSEDRYVKVAKYMNSKLWK